MTVLSVILSLPLLLVLEVSGSFFFCGRGGSLPLTAAEFSISAFSFFCDLGASTGRTVGEDFGETALVDAGGCVDEFERRRPDINASGTTLDDDTGCLATELRRGVTALSESTCFRLGDEFDDLGFSESLVFRAWSMDDAFGTEPEVPPLLPEPRELVLVTEDATICGLPPDRPFVGIGTAADFADDRPEVLFLRESTKGIPAFAADLTGLVDGRGLPVARSSAALTSDGMGT